MIFDRTYHPGQFAPERMRTPGSWFIWCHEGLLNSLAVHDFNEIAAYNAHWANGAFTEIWEAHPVWKALTAQAILRDVRFFGPSGNWEVFRPDAVSPLRLYGVAVTKKVH